MTPFDIYLWQQADTVICILAVPSWITVIVASVIWFVFGAHSPICEDFKLTAKSALKAIKIALPVALLAALIPSSKTIAMMVAIPAIANSEPIQKDLPELYQLAKEAIKEQLLPKK